MAEEKNVAQKSSTMLPRMIGWRAVKRMPSRMSLQRMRRDPRGSGAAAACSTGPISARASSTAPNDSALNRYTVFNPVVAIITPPSMGPRMAPVLKAMDCSEKALGRSVRGTRLGTKDWRAGRSKAMAAAWMPVSR